MDSGTMMMAGSALSDVRASDWRRSEIRKVAWGQRMMGNLRHIIIMSYVWQGTP